MGEVSARIIWNAGYELGLRGTFGQLTVQNDFSVGPIDIVSNTYRTTVVELSGETPSVEIVSAGLSTRWEQWFGGNLFGASASLVARPNSLVRLEATASYDFATFDDGRPDLNSAVVNARLALGFTPTLGWTNFVGYNHVSESLRLQSRLRWTWARGSDLFVVYQVDLGVAGPEAREDFQSLLFKWTLRFSDTM